MARATAATWRERVRAWKASGRTAAEFADGQAFNASTLKWWAYQLGRDARQAKPPLEVAAAVRTTVPLVRVLRKQRPPSSSGLVLEVGAVRLRVEHGFDRALLVAVIDALGGR